MSLRRYLLSTLLGLMALLLIVSAVAGYLESRHELEEVFDAQLAQHAKVLRASLAPAIERQAGLLAIESWHGNINVDEEAVSEEWERDALGHAYENKIAFQLWSADGKLQARSDSAPHEPFSDYVAGYSEQQHGEHDWRVFTLSTAGGGWIQVGHRDDVRGELSAEIALQTVWPGLTLIPVMALLIVLALRRALAPITSLTASIEARTPEQLQPLPTELAPEEIQPLVRSFNTLMERLANAFQQQRRFIADAAHELRTPLAALQVHTENALASDGAERTEALRQVRAGIVRTNRLVEQLLLLSRLEHSRQPGNTIAVPQSKQNLSTLTQQLLDELAILLKSKHQQLEFVPLDNAQVSGSEMALRALLRNLLDNAIRYSPEHSRLQIRISRSAQELCWQLCDEGPGIDPSKHEQVFEPFYRELGHHVTGSGLGLAIAQEAALQLGAQIRLHNRSPQGLCVEVCWPADSAASLAPERTN